MAMVYRAMGDWEKVHQLINRVIRFNLQEPLYLTNIGTSFDYLHNFDSALIYHQKAINIDPQWAASYDNKIESLLRKYGNTTAARSLLDSARRNTHQSYNEIKIGLDIYDGKYSEAFTEAVRSGPKDFSIKAERYLCLADISGLLNKKEDAVRYYDSALVDLNDLRTTDNNNSYLHSLLGLAYAGTGNKEQAVAEGKRAIDLTVEDKNKMKESDMIITLAQIYTKLGLFDEAIKNIEYLLKNPSNFSPKLLELDPVWKPLLNRPEIKSLLRKYP
jgi:tetratricopeptide (TPR) repeat protein